MTTSNNQNSIEAIGQTLAKHFPDETPHELLTRMQSLLTFVGSLDPKLLAYSSKNPTAQHQHPSHQPVMLHQYVNKKYAPTPMGTPLEKEIRDTLLSQITKIQEINHLEPAQRVSASRKFK